MLCFDDTGQVFDIPAERMQPRLAVYGVLIEDDQILLLPQPTTSWWQLPGGTAELEEGPQAALLRYVRQTTNIAPVIGPLLLVEDRYRAVDSGQGWLLTCFYYELKRLRSDVAGLIDFENPARPEWVNLDDLTRDEILFGYDAIQAGLVHRKVQATTS